MSIIEYDTEFTQLSRYAPQLVAIEALRAKRFIQGLIDPLFTTLAPQIGKVTYAEVMNAALLIESGKMERKASREAAKKLKTWGSFSGGSSFGERLWSPESAEGSSGKACSTRA